MTPVMTRSSSHRDKLVRVMQNRSGYHLIIGLQLLALALPGGPVSAQDLFAPSVTITANSQNAVAAFNQVKQRAHSAFSAGHYQQAFNTYLPLARYGDKFSQYRLAVMLQDGLGVEQDLTQAVAWAYVAAEKQTQPALGLFQSIKAAMTNQQWHAAEPLAMQYLADYGISASSRRAYNIIRRQLRDCTGSRLGARCDRVYASSINCNTTGWCTPPVIL